MPAAKPKKNTVPLRPAAAAFGAQTSFTLGIGIGEQSFNPKTKMAAGDIKKQFASFLTPGGGSFLGDRGRLRLENLRLKREQHAAPEFDINDENFDGAPDVVDDDPIDFKPVIVNEEDDDQLVSQQV